jgi:uncharacterized protein (DUF433 family)
MRPRKLDRITINSAVMNGQACIRGMRLAVRRVIGVLALNPERADLKQEYPELEDEDITQALEFAAHCLDEQRECGSIERRSRLVPHQGDFFLRLECLNA